MKKISKLVTAVLVASLISGCGKETPAVEETAENVAVSEETEETTEETVPDDVEEAGDVVEETSVEGYAFSFNDDFYFNIPEGWYISEWGDFGDDYKGTYLTIVNPSELNGEDDESCAEWKNYTIYIVLRSELENDRPVFKFEYDEENSNKVGDNLIYYAEYAGYKKDLIWHTSTEGTEYAVMINDRSCENNLDEIGLIFEMMLKSNNNLQPLQINVPLVSSSQIAIDEDSMYKLQDEEGTAILGITPTSKYVNEMYNYSGETMLKLVYDTYDMNAAFYGEMQEYETEIITFYSDCDNSYSFIEKYFFSDSKQLLFPSSELYSDAKYYVIDSTVPADTINTVFGDTQIFYVEEDYIKKGLTWETILHYDTEVAMINNNGHNIIIIDRYYNDKHYEPSEQMPNAEGRREGYQGRLKAFFEESGLLAE